MKKTAPRLDTSCAMSSDKLVLMEREIDGLLRGLRESWEGLMDPVPDVRLIREPGCLLMVFDGGGYDYFSYQQPEGDAGQRQKLAAIASQIGLRMEDKNSYSIVFWRD